MELKHRFLVPASVEETWSLFSDIGSVATCFPGAAVESVDGDEFAGSVKIKLGPIAMQYRGTATIAERHEAERRIVIRARGKDKRGQGTADATITTVLAGDGDGTLVDATTELAVTGKPAQFGSGMMQDVSETFLAQFVESISQRLAPPAASADANGRGGAPPVDGSAPQARTDATPAAAEIDLVAAVVPTLIRRYALVLGAAAMVLLLVHAGRRRR